MTPKEKAKELVDRFFNFEPLGGTAYICFEDAKEHASYVVDEIQNTIVNMFNGYYTLPEEWRQEFDYLDLVKEEIEKL